MLVDSLRGVPSFQAHIIWKDLLTSKIRKNIIMHAKMGKINVVSGIAAFRCYFVLIYLDR